MTLTEYNRDRAKLARIAEHEDVYIEKHGQPYLVLRRDERLDDPLERMRAQGLVEGPVPGAWDRPIPDFEISIEEAREFIRQWEAERYRDDGDYVY